MQPSVLTGHLGNLPDLPSPTFCVHSVLTHPLLSGSTQIWPLQKGLLLTFELELVTAFGLETVGHPVRLPLGTCSVRNQQAGLTQSESPRAGRTFV